MGTLAYQIVVRGSVDMVLYQGTFRVRVVREDPSVWSGDDYKANTSTTGLLSLTGTKAMAEGTIEQTSDADWFRVVLAGGKSYSIEARAKSNGSIDGLDNPALVLYDTSGNELARALNGGANQLDASLFYAVPGSAPTTFYIGVYSERGRGAYEVVVTDLKNDVGNTACYSGRKNAC